MVDELLAQSSIAGQVGYPDDVIVSEVDDTVLLVVEELVELDIEVEVGELWETGGPLGQ